MAFPSTIGSKPDSLDAAWQLARGTAGSLKQRSINLNTASLAGPVSADVIIAYCENLANCRDTFARIAAVPGIVAYAREQVNDPALDVTAAFTAMVNAIDATRSWIVTNFPHDGGNYLLASQFDVNGRQVYRTFDTATLAGFRAQLAALIATID